MILFAVFIVIAAGVATALVWQPRQALVAGVAIAVLATCCLLFLIMASGETLGLGGAQLVATPFARFFLVTAAAGFLTAVLVGAAHGAPRNLALAALTGLAALTAALTVTDPAAALLAVTAAGLAGLVATVGEPVSMPMLRVAADGLKLAAVAGLLGMAGIALVGNVAGAPASQMVGTGVLAVGAAVAVRLGAAPAHIPAARLVETARLAAIPLVAVWLPAGFAVVGLSWMESIVVGTAASTPIAHLTLAVVGAIAIGLAGAVALLDDDLGRLLGYGLIADGGFVVLATASSDPAAFAAARTWLVCLGISRTVMAASVLALEGTFATRRVRDLNGWLRRMPVTGLALLLAALVGVGLPTMLPFEARRTLAVLALGDGFGLVVLLLGALPLLGLARLAWVGLRPPGAAVTANRGEWPVQLPDRALPVRRRLQLAWQLDRLPITSVAVLLLGLISLLIAFGIGDLTGAAAAAAPGS
ncbi:MAG: proton-conducting transporter membrane subunit [Candidatus Limnocylindrales bacterium]